VPILLYALLALFLGLLFFGLIPAVGAFMVRARWRRFRSGMIEASNFRILDYTHLSSADEKRPYRLFGNLEAFQGTDRIWVKGDNFSAAAELKNVTVHVLPGNHDGVLPDEAPQRVAWRQISSLPAGTQILLAGSITRREGQIVFQSRPKNPLLLVIYDGERRSLLRRAIWSGRQRNEYWNQFTIISLITGMVALFLLSYAYLSNPGMRTPALIALTLGFSPLGALLPPGVVALFFYRRYWKRARTFRAERDLQRLPLRYFSPEQDLNQRRIQGSLPDGERYIMIRGSEKDLEARFTDSDETFILSSPRGSDSEFYAFGVAGREPDSLDIPADPMAERVRIEGNPEKNARFCATRARLFEILSAFFFALDIAPNVVLLLYALHTMIR
jgi:hypothetical protein